MDLIHVSQNIRMLRQSRGMTVEQLAVKSGFSKGFISQVENFRITPSLKALNAISGVLGVDVGDLFQAEAPSPEYSFGHLNNGTEIIRNNNKEYGIRYMALAYRQMDRAMDPFIVEYSPSNQTRGFLMHDAEEFFMILEGAVDFFILDEKNVHRMTSGDTLYMKANLPHKVQLADGCRFARALLVYAEKKFSGSVKE